MTSTTVLYSSSDTVNLHQQRCMVERNQTEVAVSGKCWFCDHSVGDSSTPELSSQKAVQDLQGY